MYGSGPWWTMERQKETEMKCDGSLLRLRTPSSVGQRLSEGYLVVYGMVYHSFNGFRLNGKNWVRNELSIGSEGCRDPMV
jgi:hypothetical protein